MQGSEVGEPCVVIEIFDLLDGMGHDCDERPRGYWRVEEGVFGDGVLRLLRVGQFC